MTNPISDPFPRQPVASAPPPDCRAPGIYPDMPFGEYLGDPAWGSSDLRTMRQGPPARVLWKRANGSSDTDATRLGTACHAAILTPDLFYDSYVTKPEDAPDKPTAAMLAAKKRSPSSEERVAWWAEFNARHGGKQVLPVGMGRDVVAIRESVLSHVVARESIVNAYYREASIFWNDPDTGEPCKARPDWFDADWVYDLKISRHAGPSLAFRAYAEGWMHQSAHYRYGLRHLGLGARLGARLVVVEPKAPHYVYCVQVKDAALDFLMLDNVNTLARMKGCRVANDWPGIVEEWTVVAPPEGAILETLAAIDLSGAEEVDGD